MHHPSTSLSRRLFLPLALATAALTAGCAPTVALAQGYYPPVPPLRAEVRPPAPRGEHWAWQPGHWHWSGRAYDWIPGEWVERPDARLSWAHGHWVWRRPEGWIWVPGHWR
ncbi:hypothetical protein [Falsiroseomonas sp.]|uniref:hypothetical protein n=1 Tax=Falsiroseomonas sp. TaxID=2870721 RepID=UPI003F7293CA